MLYRLSFHDMLYVKYEDCEHFSSIEKNHRQQNDTHNISDATMLRKLNAFDLIPNMCRKKNKYMYRKCQYVTVFAVQVQVLAKAPLKSLLTMLLTLFKKC